MNDLISKVASTAGITEDQAKQAVECVKSFVQSKMPDFFDEHIAKAFDGTKVELSDILKDKASNFADEAKTALSNLADKTEEAFGKAGDKISDLFDKKKS